MTREEAVKILNKIWGGNPQHDLANSYLDAFVALGMLKLYEPARDKAIEALWGTGSNITPYEVLKALDTAGLKIVEK